MYYVMENDFLEEMCYIPYITLRVMAYLREFVPIRPAHRFPLKQGNRMSIF